MKATDVNDAYFEIILRDSNMVPTYGGWLVPANSLEMSDEIVNGHRVIVAKTDTGDVRHEFDPAIGQYGPASNVSSAASSVVLRRKVHELRTYSDLASTKEIA